jgi:glutaminyl-tRNA synthetase
LGWLPSSAAFAICVLTTPTPPRKRWYTSGRFRRTSVGWVLTGVRTFFYASDYFGQLYEYAIRLIEKGKAYVCDLTPEEVREYRGNLTEPGKESQYRNRPVEENLDLLRRMRAGDFESGERTLRAKIDMASPNLNLRDPVLYRILKETHHRTGDVWPIYPMYDFAHGQSDSIENVTHSVCTLEFEDHRPLYDWLQDELDIYHSQQIEFARLNITHTVLSKRRLIQLVDEEYVNGWDDPRLPTISGLRRRGYTPEALRDFCDRIGVAKRDNTVDIALLEYTLRDHLNKRAFRVMGVLDPLKVVITNYPEGKSEDVVSVNNPEDMSMGERKIKFSRTVYIEKDDFREVPLPKFYRLSPGREIRLKDAFYITCNEVIKDEATGEIIELRCTYDPETYGGTSADGRKVRGTSHWVSATHAVDAEVRIYDHLFSTEDSDDVPDGGVFTDNLNSESLVVMKGCKLEQGLGKAKPGERFQFLRMGYFVVDSDSTPEAPVFNRTVALRDTWTRMDQARKQSR